MYHLISLFILLYIFLLIFLAVTFAITITILIYNNLVQIHTNLILITYKYFASILPLSLKCYCHLHVITCLYFMYPSKCIYNYCFMHLSFKSYRRKKKNHEQKIQYCLLYLPIWLLLPVPFIFHVYLSYYLVSFHFGLKTSISISCRAFMIVTNPLFCLFWSVFIPP